MLCPKCDTYYTDDKRFCRDCGHALVPTSGAKSRKSLVSDVLFVVLAVALAFGAGYVLIEKVSSRAPEPELQTSAPAANPASVTPTQAEAFKGLAGGPSSHLRIAPKKNLITTLGPEYETSACLIEDGSDNLALSISTKPRDAILFFDGEKRGKSPLVVRNLTAGKHTIGVSKNGYKTRNISVNLVCGDNKEFTISLEKKQADVTKELIRDPLRVENRI